MNAIRLFNRHCDARGVSLMPLYLPSVLNLRADKLSQQRERTQSSVRPDLLAHVASHFTHTVLYFSDSHFGPAAFENFKESASTALNRLPKETLLLTPSLNLIGIAGERGKRYITAKYLIYTRLRDAHYCQSKGSVILFLPILTCPNYSICQVLCMKGLLLCVR